MTLMLGGRYPPLRTSIYRPSGVTADAIGNVESSTCRPTGSSFQPLFRRKPPVGSGPTCSRGAVCELSMAASETSPRPTNHAIYDFIGLFLCGGLQLRQDDVAYRFQLERAVVPL